MTPRDAPPSPLEMSGQKDSAAISLRWVLRVRAWGLVAQVATVLFARFVLGTDLPLAALGAVATFTLLSNIGLQIFLSRGGGATTETVAFTLASDALLLTAILYLTGGPANPFSVLFLVQITIAALVLSPPYTLAIVLLSLACYAVLFLTRVPIPDMSGMRHDGRGGWSLHLEQMFFAFALAAGLIGYFVTRVSSALRERERLLSLAEKKAQGAERLAALTSLSAGAAHELGTPLMTISLAAQGLVDALRDGDDGSAADVQSLREDAALILKESARCRDIVQQMRLGAGGASGDTPELTSVGALKAEVTRRLGQLRAGRLQVRGAHAPPFVLPWRGLVQSLVSLIDNALEASRETGTEVSLDFSFEGTLLIVVVEDHGSGMSKEHLARVGEPFWSTKPPGYGMGLGVLLARAYAERHGGALRLTSEPGRGTVARMEVPTNLAHSPDTDARDKDHTSPAP